ncbi:hypothetical protein [Bacillus wiedmannii]|uniref:hypothetical protein n=1 Tax=Bacillus wiedmannii TaxID=1890302 RepID=UPI0008693308|nr:hypothetical protein [Bacillus wiedmannii]SCN41820.1 Protein of unknown function [Bacillus wiedmannii]
MVLKKVAVTLVNIKNERTDGDPGNALEIYGDLYVSKMVQSGYSSDFEIQTERMWHRNSTDRVDIKEGYAHDVNNRKEFKIGYNEYLSFFGPMFDHDTWPNDDDDLRGVLRLNYSDLPTKGKIFGVRVYMTENGYNNNVDTSQPHGMGSCNGFFCEPDHGDDFVPEWISANYTIEGLEHYKRLGKKKRPFKRLGKKKRPFKRLEKRK